jgi:hypothetical protein
MIRKRAISVLLSANAQGTQTERVANAVDGVFGDSGQGVGAFAIAHES